MKFINSVLAILPPEDPPGTFSVSFTPKSPEFFNLTNITVTQTVSVLISLVLIVTTLLFFFILVIGGLKWLTSGGDEKAVAAARSQIANGLIGLTIVFSAWAVIKLIEIIFGIKILTGLTIPTL